MQLGHEPAHSKSRWRVELHGGMPGGCSHCQDERTWMGSLRGRRSVRHGTFRQAPSTVLPSTKKVPHSSKREFWPFTILVTGVPTFTFHRVNDKGGGGEMRATQGLRASKRALPWLCSAKYRRDSDARGQAAYQRLQVGWPRALTSESFSRPGQDSLCLAQCGL